MNFSIDGLVNGTEYCYVIEARGSYNLDEIPEPLINDSNESCARAMDDAPPCSPEFFVSSICDDDRLDFILELVNTVTWEYDGLICSQPEDLSHVNVYYSEREDEELTLLSALDPDRPSFDHQLDENIAGCYAVSAVDISGNESALSPPI